MPPLSLALDPAFRVGPVGRRTLGSLLASAVDMDQFVESVTATADTVRHTDRVRSASIAQVSEHEAGDVIHVASDAPAYETAKFGEVSVLARHNSIAALVDGRLTVQVPPVSSNVVRLGS